MFEDVLKNNTPTEAQCGECKNKRCICRTCRGEKRPEYLCDCAWGENADCFESFNPPPNNLYS